MAIQPPGPPVVSGQFQLFATGLALGFAKSVKIPIGKPKPTKMQSAGNPFEIKYPSGMIEFDDLEVKLFHVAGQESMNWLLAWRDRCVSLVSGATGTTPDAAKEAITVQEMDGGGNVVAEWKCTGCFPVDLGALDHEAGKEDAVELDLKFSVDKVDKAGR